MQYTVVHGLKDTVECFNIHSFFLVWSVTGSKMTFGTLPVSRRDSFESQAFCFACGHLSPRNMLCNEILIVHPVGGGEALTTKAIESCC